MGGEGKAEGGKEDESGGKGQGIKRRERAGHGAAERLRTADGRWREDDTGGGIPTCAHHGPNELVHHPAAGLRHRIVGGRTSAWPQPTEGGPQGGGGGGSGVGITDRKRNSARPRTARNRPALLAGAGPLGRHGVATTRVSRIKAACEAQDQEGLSQMGPTRIKYASKVPKSGTRDLANSTMNFMPMYAFRSVVRFVLQRILLLFDSDGRRPPSCLACPPSPGRRPPTSLLPRLPPLPPPLP